MKLSFWIGIFGIILFAAFAGTDSTLSRQPLILEFFGSRTCEECAAIKTNLLIPLEKKYGGALQINTHDIEDTAGFNLMVRMEEKYGLRSSSAQELYFPDTVLLGYDDIMRRGKGMVEKRLRKMKTGP